MAKTKAKTTKTDDGLFRKLSDVLLINSSEFATAGPTKQTAILAGNGGSLPVVFVPNFSDLADKRAIRDKLLAGVDVSRELEFNGLALDAEEIRALSLVKPVLEKIEAIGPKYPWLTHSDFSGTIDIDGQSITKGGNFIRRPTAKGIWRRASKYWANAGKQPMAFHVKANGSYYPDRQCKISNTDVKIGCQTLSRAEVEYVARECSWEPELS